MKIHVDASRCQGHARCCTVAPAVYSVNEDGYNEMPDTDVTPELEAEARKGAAACPEHAIQIEI